MNRNAKKWVAALRSGKYKRGKEQLGLVVNEKTMATKYCCLGVACELALKAGVVKKKFVGEGGLVTYDGHSSWLPPAVQEWLGLRKDNGEFVPKKRQKRDSLAELNDSGKSFSYIADFIEREPPGLFKEKGKADKK